MFPIISAAYLFLAAVIISRGQEPSQVIFSLLLGAFTLPSIVWLFNCPKTETITLTSKVGFVFLPRSHGPGLGSTTTLTHFQPGEPFIS